MCDPYVKESFLTALHSPFCAKISNLALSVVLTFLSNSFLVIGESVDSV